MRQPLQERSQESTARMLRAATGLIREGGLSAVTVAAVAERADTTSGSIYHRFISAPQLVVAVQDEFLRGAEKRIADALETATVSTPEQAARFAVETYLWEFDDFGPLYRAFLIEGHDRPELRSRGVECSKACDRVTVRFLMKHTGCDSTSALRGFYLLFALGTTRATWQLVPIASSDPTPTEWADHLPSALLALIA